MEKSEKVISGIISYQEKHGGGRLYKEFEGTAGQVEKELQNYSLVMKCTCCFAAFRGDKIHARWNGMGVDWFITSFHAESLGLPCRVYMLNTVWGWREL